MTAQPTLGVRALNRALLARQGLLERADLPIPDALERLCGIQNQYAPNAYLRLWSCLAGFRRADLTAALEDGLVLQGTLMRGTIHVVSATDYAPMLAAIAPTQARWADRVHRSEPVDREPWVAKVRRAMADGPVRRPALLAALEGAPPAVLQSIDTDAAILRVPPSGTWDRRRADLCAPAPEAAPLDEDVSLAWLIGRYLAGFGPATTGDIASFVGMNITPIKTALASMDLRRFRAEDGSELLDVPDGVLPDPETPAPVRFLPTWDAALLVHARRTQVLPEPFRPMIFNVRMPASRPTVLVDGQVAATWRWEDDEIRIEPLRTLSRAERAEVDDEAHRLAAFHGPEG